MEPFILTVNSVQRLFKSQLQNHLISCFLFVQVEDDDLIVLDPSHSDLADLDDAVNSDDEMTCTFYKVRAK